ncbi:S1 family peptidase [Embleya sp. MST-111070]|uniref:S1 family peptidase n=1 Tax=Embleya sp. MST-111070 TaxID=3398231 RepID=UPI003F736422
MLRPVLTIARGGVDGPVWLAGSGNVVRPGIVVTAGHNIGAGDRSVRAGGVEYPFTVVYDGRQDGLDLAVLDVDGLREAHAVTRFARVDRESVELLHGCWATGFPRFMEQRAQGRPLRDTAQAFGTIAPGSGLVSGHLRLSVTSPPSDLARESPWEGMSGAVVFARDRDWHAVALGIVVEHGLAEGPGSLTVLPFTALDELADSVRGRVWGLLGGGHALSTLPSRKDVHNLEAPGGAWTLLETLWSRRAFSHGDHRLVHSPAIQDHPSDLVTDALASLNTSRAVAVARSLGHSAVELRAALGDFAEPAPLPVRRAVRTLERLCQDHAENFDPGYGRGPDFFVHLPTIGHGLPLHDLSLGPTPLGMPADDSFAAFRVLARFLAQSCEHLVKVRKAALKLVSALVETYPTLRTEGDADAVAKSIRNGITQLRKLAPALQRAADVVGDVIDRCDDLDARRDHLTALIRQQDGATARLLHGIAAVPSMQTWIVPTPVPSA